MRRSLYWWGVWSLGWGEWWLGFVVVIIGCGGVCGMIFDDGGGVGGGL
jgi:hypothetical protein